VLAAEGMTDVPTAATHCVAHEYTAASAAEVSAAQGQQVTLISKSGEWSKIRLLSSGLEGYIAGSFLKEISTAPPPAPAAGAQDGTIDIAGFDDMGVDGIML